MTGPARLWTPPRNQEEDMAIRIGINSSRRNGRGPARQLPDQRDRNPAAIGWAVPAGRGLASRPTATWTSGGPR
jgi:hypothetical protein